MSDLHSSTKSFISISEMAELCQLSRSRFYELMEAKVFPNPVQHPSCKRPMYDRELQEKCLEIRQSGIGLNGQPVLFNRKPRKGSKSRPLRTPHDKLPDNGALLEALKCLGLSVMPQAVDEAVAALFPKGTAGLDQGDVIRKVFLHLQTKKK